MKNKLSSKIVISAGLLTATIALQGCGYLNRQFPSLGLPEYEVTPTGVGAATGTALGGGVGALIGSASGNLGGGAFLGAASGATAGAVIGNQVHRADQAITLQEKRVLQQRRQIEMLDRELESIRQQQGDRVVSAYRPSYTDGTARGSLSRHGVQPGLPGSDVQPSITQRPSVPVGDEFSRRRLPNRSSLVEENIATRETARPVELAGYNVRSSTLGARQEAQVYSAEVNDQELRRFLSNVPVREARTGVEPVRAAKNVVRGEVFKPVARQAVRNQEVKSQVVRTQESAPVREVVIPSAPVQPTIVKPVQKYESPAPIRPASIRPVQPRTVETAPVQIAKNSQPVRSLPTAQGVTERVVSSDDRKVTFNIPPAKKAATIGVAGSTYSSGIEPGTVRKVGENGRVNEERALKEAARAPSPVRKVEKVVAPASVVSAPPSQLQHSSPSCVEAENEAQRAREATSDADRLFYYRRALRLCGESSNYHLETGKAYAAIDRIEDAAFEFRQAIDLDPNNQAAIQQLSILERK